MHIAYLTHPDNATLVDPLFGKPQRGRKHFFNHPLSAIAERGWSSEVMTGPKDSFGGVFYSMAEKPTPTISQSTAPPP